MYVTNEEQLAVVSYYTKKWILNIIQEDDDNYSLNKAIGAHY